MYASLRLRSQESLEVLCDAFNDIVTLQYPAFDAQPCAVDRKSLIEEMAHARALSTPDIPTYHTTASTPSMRSRDAVDVPRPFTPEGDGGNVKVVVRVRKFIRRGKADESNQYAAIILTEVQRSRRNHHASSRWTQLLNKQPYIHPL